MGEIALTFAKDFPLSAVKTCGEEMLNHSVVAQSVEVATKRKTPKPAGSSMTRKKLWKQVDGGVVKRVIR